MKALLIYTLSATLLLASEPLAQHRWKHRVILMFSDDDYTEVLQRSKAGIKERDIIYYHFTGKGVTTNGSKLNDAQKTEVINAYRQKGNVILLGKDGGIKDASETLQLRKLFTLIDGMPMRRREMRSQK